MGKLARAREDARTSKRAALGMEMERLLGRALTIDELMNITTRASARTNVDALLKGQKHDREQARKTNQPKG